ncbi:MAG: hypothetical protein WAO69_09890 [Aestuariivita sp.]|uniref:hypothetical protein n=1 Tax=Aestuariivita sp. TaxID=1872407 RepID=UPI003BB06628
MAKLTKTTLFKATLPRAETPMDKTTRAARIILDGEAENRQLKTARLRKARLEREASPSSKPIPAAPKAKRRTPQIKAAK